MRLYVDANIIIESVCAGVNGNDLVEQAFTYQERGESLISSVLTAVEIDRYLWRRSGVDSLVTPTMLRGIDLLALTPQVIDVARAIPAQFLKTLDALHVATAIVSRCDAVITLDRQFARACQEVGLTVV
jgi:predicted nucleic acid-binding protein